MLWQSAQLVWDVRAAWQPAHWLHGLGAAVCAQALTCCCCYCPNPQSVEVVADVVAVSLELSADELLFAFGPDNWEHHVEQVRMQHPAS